AVRALSALVEERAIRMELGPLAGDGALRGVARERARAGLSLVRKVVVGTEDVCRRAPVAAVPDPVAELGHAVAGLRPGELRHGQVLPLGVEAIGLLAVPRVVAGRRIAARSRM